MDDTNTNILRAAMKGVRLYGLEGVRIKNIAELANLTPGAIYRYFESKEDLMRTCFVTVDRQVAALFDQIQLDLQMLDSHPVEQVRALWHPYFRFWIAHPDETVFYHRFRDSASFPKYDRLRDVRHFDTFIQMVENFRQAYPGLNRLNTSILSLHMLTSTVLCAKYVVEGTLPDTEETENSIFQLLMAGLSSFLTPAPPNGACVHAD